MAIFGLFLMASPVDGFAKKKKQDVTYEEMFQKVEDYIKSITTMKARFKQSAEVYSKGLTGNFYLSRPGKLRFEYDKPIEDLVVADGKFIYFYDSELESYSSALVNSTLASFLVRKDPGLVDGDIDALDISRDSTNKLLGMTLIYKDAPEKGRLTLIFKEKPKFELVRWQVVDAQGYVTQIELSDIKRDVKLDEDLFVFVDPDIANPGYN